jgi:hypothetical protein
MLSPFAHQLNTNYVPSDNEIVAIRSLVRKGEATLNDIERRTEELEQELIELRERWEAQKREVDEHKALLSPIKRIPVDILTSIFLAVLENHGRRQIISADHSAVVISHVCQHWRTVSLSTKLLWCNLIIDIPSYHGLPNPRWNAKVAKLVEMTQVWISRSDNCHLRIEIMDLSGGIRRDVDALFSEGTDFHKLVDVLLSSSSRWKDLDLKLHIPQTQLPYFPAMRLLAPHPQPTPVLTKVTLSCDEQRQEDNSLSQRLITGPNILSTPTLRSLEIGPKTLAHDIMRTPVVWSNLEHLDFSGYPAESSLDFDAVQALTLFKECTNLITCFFTLQQNAFIPTNHGPPIILPRLRELAFLPYESHLPQGFAHSLVLPSLRKLEVLTGYGECTPREHHESGLFEFCERFGSTLQDVTFCYRVLTQSALRRCLQCLPNVTSLGLVSINRITLVGVSACLNRDTILQLTPQANVEGTPIIRSPLCPKIEAFQFGANRGELAEDALVEFIEARRREVSDRPLAGGGNVTLLQEVNCGDYNFKSIDPREVLRERGVDMEGFSLTRFYHFH